MRGLTSGAHKEASSAQFESYAKALRSSLAGRDIDLSRSDWLEIMSQQLGFPNWNTCRALLEVKMTASSNISVHHGSQHEAALFYKTAFRAKILRKHPHQGELIAVDIMSHGLAVSVVGSNPRRKVEPWRGGLSFRKRQN